MSRRIDGWQLFPDDRSKKHFLELFAVMVARSPGDQQAHDEEAANATVVPRGDEDALKNAKKSSILRGI
jgi:hypothetical protein